MSKNELKANHNRQRHRSAIYAVGKYDVKERIESKSQLVDGRNLFVNGWQIWCQRTNWKQITTRWTIQFGIEMLANMMSKNELKANHNPPLRYCTPHFVGKYDVKERIESKSQHICWTRIYLHCWQIWCQRTNWKQITTPASLLSWAWPLANMMSKNE